MVQIHPHSDKPLDEKAASAQRAFESNCPPDQPTIMARSQHMLCSNMLSSYSH